MTSDEAEEIINPHMEGLKGILESHMSYDDRMEILEAIDFHYDQWVGEYDPVDESSDVIGFWQKKWVFLKALFGIYS